MISFFTPLLQLWGAQMYHHYINSSQIKCSTTQYSNHTEREKRRSFFSVTVQAEINWSISLTIEKGHRMLSYSQFLVTSSSTPPSRKREANEHKFNLIWIIKCAKHRTHTCMHGCADALLEWIEWTIANLQNVMSWTLSENICVWLIECNK